MLYLSILAGFGMLVLGGDGLVRGAVAIARHFHLSPLLIGLTLVGFGTSMPELLTSVQAALLGSPGIAVGNVVGSNIANVLLIMGAAVAIRPMITGRDSLVRDGGVMLAATFFAIALFWWGEIGRPAGGLLVIGLLAYIAGTYLLERKRGAGEEAVHQEKPIALAWALHLTVGALGATLLGANLLVTGAIELAQSAGISETIIGLTLIAVGTSLPELVTGVMAALRGHSDVALGNVIGSNINNILGILGVTALVKPIFVPADLAAVDVAVMTGATLLLLLFAVTGFRLSRGEGFCLLTAYAGYIGYLAWISV
ncbi:MAG: calcium/sodium antiporter [Geminicoccaceae bacterium]